MCKGVKTASGTKRGIAQTLTNEDLLQGNAFPVAVLN